MRALAFEFLRLRWPQDRLTANLPGAPLVEAE